ncbi:MAG: hypothetical protein IJT95_06935 [Abditibacteriota bacterium]|nr:hypothetical protein [Abditibacteriota bacterium]
MTNREKFINYVKYGGALICSPQIGAGAGYDTKIAGKKWISETTLEDLQNTLRRYDIVPLYNFGIDFGMVDSELAWKPAGSTSSDTRRTWDYVMETAAGTLTQSVTEEPMKGSFRTKCPVTSAEDLTVQEYYMDKVLASNFAPITAFVRGLRDRIGEEGALDIQWPVQPYEMLCFADTVTTVMLVMDHEELCCRIMEKVIEINRKAFKAVKEGGADFVFLGGPGSEMISPAFYRNFLVPYSKITTADAHSEGLLVYSHICSPIEPFLTMGFYNEMGMDLFETLSPKPVGNVESLADALAKIDPRICTRGNLGLDVLLTGTPAEVREKTIEIIEAGRGRKHMVAASDYLFYDIPEENLRAMVDTVSEYSEG